MNRKPSRSTIAKKAWRTRKANAKMASLMENAPPKFVPPSVNKAMSLFDQLDDTLATLEVRLSKTILRINGMM